MEQSVLKEGGLSWEHQGVRSDCVTMANGLHGSQVRQEGPLAYVVWAPGRSEPALLLINTQYFCQLVGEYS